jgi:hypothetical protein
MPLNSVWRLLEMLRGTVLCGVDLRHLVSVVDAKWRICRKRFYYEEVEMVAVVRVDGWRIGGVAWSVGKHARRCWRAQIRSCDGVAQGKAQSPSTTLLIPSPNPHSYVFKTAQDNHSIPQTLRC